MLGSSPCRQPIERRNRSAAASGEQLVQDAAFLVGRSEVVDEGAIGLSEARGRPDRVEHAGVIAVLGVSVDADVLALNEGAARATGEVAGAR